MPNTLDNIPVDQGYTPTPVMGVPITQRVGSPSFIAIISIIVGIILGCGGIIGVLGRAFFVSKDEYTAKELKAAEEKGKETSDLTRVLERLSQSLMRQEEAMTNQKVAFEKLSDIVHAMKWDKDLASSRGRSR